MAAEPAAKRKREEATDERIGFVGGGSMAVALLSGFLSHVAPESVSVSVATEASAERLRTQFPGVYVTRDNAEVLTRSTVVFLSVKPFILLDVLRKLVESGSVGSQLFISVAAGVPLASMEAILGGCRLARVMPNTPCHVLACASGFSMGSRATAEDAALVKLLMEWVGVAHEVPENLLAAVTGVSGSGPAYIFLIIEALADGGVKTGLPRAVALELAAQTVYGAAKMVLETGKHPAQLKDSVATAGGTTINALHQLEVGGVRAAMMNAVVASSERAKELAKL